MKAVTMKPTRLAGLILALMVLSALGTHHFSKPDQTLYDCKVSKQKWIEAYNNCQIENAEICNRINLLVTKLTRKVAP